jgi:hypothetical protein
MGRWLKLRPDWEKIKLSIMEDLLRQKFSPAKLGTFLESTVFIDESGEPTTLVEKNWWGDRFWGVYEDSGENHLGKLLMKIRKELCGK